MASRSCINRWVLVGLNSVSWIFSVATLASCTFLKFSDDQVDEDEHYEYGLFSLKNEHGSCESFSNTEAKDAGFIYYQAAQAFGVLQNLSLVFSMTGILLVMLCLPAKAAKWVWLATKIMYCVALLLTLLIFIGFADCNVVEFEGWDCKPGAAAIINMVNSLFVLTMAIWCWFIPVPTAPICGCCGGCASPSPLKTQPYSPTGGTTIVKRTVEATPEGRKIMEEVTHPDGSKTITETLEQE